MGGDRAPVLDRDAVRLWTRALDIRCVTLTLVALTSPLMPTFRDDLPRNLAVLWGLVVPYSVLLCLLIRRRNRLEPVMPVLDIGVALAFAWVSPDVWLAIASVCVADVAFAVVSFGRRVGVLAAAVGAVGLGATGLGIDGGIDVGVLGFAIASVIVITTVGSVTARERQLRRSYTTLVNGVDGIVFERDAATNRLTFVSSQVETILGWNVEEARLDPVWVDRMHPDDVDEISRQLRDARADRGQITDFRVRHADGHWVWLRMSLTVERDTSGNAVAIRGIAVDVTQERHATLALQQYADIVEQIQFALLVWHLPDPDDPLSLKSVRINPAAARQFGMSPDEVGGRLIDRWPQHSAERMAESIARTIVSQQGVVLPKVSYPQEDGSERWLSVRIFPLPARCAGVVAQDITDEHHADLVLRHQALHDTLTGLPNRALLQDRLATALATAKRTGHQVALLVMDLDQFKEINDTLGHPMGDRMLEEVGNRLASVLRDCDTVARLGGDEFAVLLTTDADRLGAERVAMRVREALASPFDLSGIAVETAASIGIVLSPENGTDAGTLTQRADIAMYAAKRGGRGYAFYDPEDDRSSIRRLALVSDLRRAVERDELVLHYQPQVDVRTGEVLGFEALVRWMHPEHGLLLPTEFIPLAEVSGTIQPLTRWVVRTAVHQAAHLAAAGHPVVMSANVSARNLYDPELVSGIGSDLADAGVPAELLMLELTESELVDDPSQVMTVLSLVSDMGVHLSIDDFGTGWSSLANLTRLPIHQIKIDRSFVSRMLDGGDDAVIVRSIVDLGHNLGLAVVAEGVEDAPTLNALERLGCDQAQGYLVSRPMPAEEVLPWLRQRTLQRRALHLA